MSQIEYIFVFLFIFIASLVNSLQFFVGLINTPKDTLYLGTIHNPGDYFYYLSQFKQGTYRFLSGYDLLTGEYKDATFIQWINILLGKIFSLFGINAITAYQISVFLFTCIVLFLSYLLIRSFFSNKSDVRFRLISFVLFIFSNSFPVFLSNNSGVSWTYGNFWFNSGIPFVRLGGVPHHLVTSCCILITILLIHSWILKGNNIPKPISLGIILLTGIIFASLNPVQWLLILFAGGLAMLFTLASNFIKKNRDLKNLSNSFISWQSAVLNYVPHIVRNYLPFFLLLLGGLPVILYYQKVFSYPPFIQLKQWEATHQLYISWKEMLWGYGPIALLGFISIPFLFSHGRFISYITALIPLLGITLFFSKIPQKFDLHNIRFLVQIIILFLTISATNSLKWLSDHFFKHNFIYILIIIFILISITLPSWYLQIKEYSQKPLNYDVSFYIHKDMVDFFNKVSKLSTPKDVFLVAWPYNLPFPALTGRRVFHAHDLLTIDYPRKDAQAYQFFNKNMNTEQMKQFLKENQIDYIIANTWNTVLSDISYATKIQESGGLMLFKVIK